MPVRLSPCVRSSSVLLMLCLATTSVAWADAPAKGHWSGSAELGASITTGNSQTRSINGQFKLKYVTGPWSHDLRLSTLQAAQNGTSTANRTAGTFSSRYQFDPRNYLFGTLHGSRDAFSGYTYQASVSAGLGRILWDTDAGKLSVEAGPGYRRSKLRNGASEGNAIVRGHAAFSYKVSHSARFTQTLSVEAGSNDTELTAETGFSVDVTKALAMKLAYTVHHNTQVPPGLVKTDTFTSINLVYAFGS